MPFIDTSLSHLEPLATGAGSMGPTAGFGENFSAATQQQFRVNSFYGLEAELNDRMRQNLDRVRDVTGQELQIDEDLFHYWIRDAKGAEIFHGRDLWRSDQYEQNARQRARQAATQLDQLKAQYPDVQSFQDILDEVVAMRSEVEGEANSAWDRANIWGMLGNVAGSAWGSLSLERDPILTGSMFLPGFGRAAATRILSAAGIGGGAELTQQFLGIQPTRRALGEAPTNPWFDVALGAALGGAFQGAGEVALPAFRAAEARLFPDRARARVFRDTLSEALAAPQALARPTNEQLSAALARGPQTTDVRSARAVLDSEIGFLALNPYGQSRGAYALAEADFAQAVETAAGRKTQTAVGRFLPQQAEAQDIVPDAIRGMARLEQPDLFRRFEEAEVRLTEAEAVLDELRTARQARTMADAIELVDPVVGQRVREIETELERPIPKARREALEAELDTMVEGMVPGRLEEVESDFQIGLKRQERSAQSSRNAAKKAYNRLRKDVERAERSVLAEMRVRTQVAGDAQQPMYGGAQEAFEALKTQERNREARVNGIVRRALEPEPRIEGEGMATQPGGEASPEPAPIDTATDFDIGDDLRIPADMAVAIGLDGAEARTVTAKQLFKEIEADEAMLEAIRSCAL